MRLGNCIKSVLTQSQQDKEFFSIRKQIENYNY